jgi:hypothetical protein
VPRARFCSNPTDGCIIGYLPASCVRLLCMLLLCSTGDTSMVSTALGPNEYIAAFDIACTMDLGAGED